MGELKPMRTRAGFWSTFRVGSVNIAGFWGNDAILSLAVHRRRIRAMDYFSAGIDSMLEIATIIRNYPRITGIKNNIKLELNQALSVCSGPFQNGTNSSLFSGVIRQNLQASDDKVRISPLKRLYLVPIDPSIR